MEIEKLSLHNLRNASHYQFQSDFSALVGQYSPQILGILAEYAEYQPLLENEAVALNVITKSATTEQIEAADQERDTIFRGMVDSVRSKLNHFNANVREAARKVSVIIDGYGNLVSKPYDEESGLITSLISDLRTKTGVEIDVIGLVDWNTELERLNNHFIGLEATRNNEVANRSELKMKEVRTEVDAAYQKIVKRINALIIVNGESDYSEFVNMLNTRIERAATAIAQSRAKKPKTQE